MCQLGLVSTGIITQNFDPLHVPIWSVSLENCIQFSKHAVFAILASDAVVPPRVVFVTQRLLQRKIRCTKPSWPTNFPLRFWEDFLLLEPMVTSRAFSSVQKSIPTFPPQLRCHSNALGRHHYKHQATV